MIFARLFAVLALDAMCRERIHPPAGTNDSRYDRAYKALWRAYDRLTKDERRLLFGPYGELPDRPYVK